MVVWLAALLQIGIFANKYLGDIIISKLGSSKLPSAKCNCRTKASDLNEVSFEPLQGVLCRVDLYISKKQVS